jgi:pimeloyl-ACP methyl ester carboxylesterase
MTLNAIAKYLLTAALCVATLDGTAYPAAAAEIRSFSVSVSGPTAGRQMILIPGLMSSGDVWAETAARYAGRYRVHVLTLSGFAGRAPIGGDAFLPVVRDELLGYIRAEHLDHPIIVGHSLGGFLAFWIAATAPDIVGPIVAVDGVPFLAALMNPGATSAAMTPQADRMRAMYATLSSSQLGAQSRMSLPTMISEPSNVERAVAWAAASDPGTVGRVMAEMSTTDLREDMPRIHSPVLLIGAAKDAPDADALARLTKAYEAQVAKAPHATVVMARRARHFVMMDDPAFFFAALDAFLDEAPAAPAKAR